MTIVISISQLILSWELGSLHDLRRRKGSVREFRQEVEERARNAGVTSETTVERDSPAAEIVAYADRVDADAIVLGAHGRSGVSRLLLGSVTEDVIRRTDRPVHVVCIGNGSENR